MSLFDFLKKKKEKPNQLDGVDTKTVVKSQSKTTTPATFHTLTIEKIEQETASAVSLYFTIPPTLKTNFAYQAGQYITIRKMVHGQPILRSYSLSSCPISDTYFRVGIKEKLGGALSSTLVRDLKAGQSIAIFPPLGSFTPDLTKNTTHYFLFAGGSGITPLLSIIKTILAKKPNSALTLLYANRNQQNIMYEKELQQLKQNTTTRFTIHHILDQPPSDWNGLTGIFKAKDYAALLQKQDTSILAQAEFFICGPEPMMQAVEQGLTQLLHLPSTQIQVEYFRMDKQPANPPPKMATNTIVTPPKTITSSNKIVATIQLEQTNIEVIIPKGETILEAVLNKGLDAPYMCEAGVCSTCRAKLESGQVQMQACHSLSKKEITEGYILTCQSIPQTPTLRINYDI